MGIESEPNMELQHFLEHLDELGPDLERWPAAIRQDARKLLEQSPAAADALADAKTLANLLAALPPVRAPAHLAGRIAGAVADPPQRLLDWLGASLWRPAVAAGLPLAFGFLVGVLLPPSQTDDSEMMLDIGLMAFAESYEELPDGE